MTSTPMNFFERVLRGIALVEDILLVSLLTLMIVLAGGQIFLRNILDTAIADSDQLLRILVLWVGMLGALAASRSDRHITVDVFSRYLSTRKKIGIRVVVDLFAALVSGVLAFHALRFVLTEYEAGAVAFGNLPAWVAQSILPIAFMLITLRYLLLFITHVKLLILGLRRA